ncbi:MAG: DUF1307 domain-containing protein [Bacilli bacterium]|nr:DUF1307 domain-containing protein [Bacilli bacterium]
MKKIIFVIMIGCILLCGCEKEKKSSTKVISNGKVVDTTKMEHKHCTREASITDGDVSLNYDIFYTGDILNILKSEEKIISASEEVLDTYEKAYRDIFQHYDGFEYYDTSVTRGDTTVVSSITINYDKIDIDKLIALEGEEDSVFQNKKPLVSKWLEFAKKFGTKCELVED